MEAPHVRRLFLMLPLIHVFFFACVCTGKDSPTIKLKSTVFVALKGEDLHISGEITKPANETGGQLMCFDLHGKEKGKVHIAPQDARTGTESYRLLLKNLSHSGKYHCKYKTAEAYWFLLVRAEGYKDLEMFDYTELSIVAAFTGVLFIFSVLGSVYVFRGHWKERITGCDDADGKEKQREDKKSTEIEEENMDVSTAQSSFYASLEPRRGSIYDVLDRSDLRTEPEDQRKPNTKKKEKELSETVKETPDNQDEGVFESVYENF